MVSGLQGVSIFRRVLLAEDRRFISTDFQATSPRLFHRCEPPSRGTDADNITFSCPFYGYCHASAALIRPSGHALPGNVALFSLILFYILSFNENEPFDHFEIKIFEL